MHFKYAAAALTAVLPFCTAQTSSKCDPTKKTCPDDDGIRSSSFTSDFTKGDSALDGWKVTSGDLKYDDQGAAFTVAKKGDAPTIETKDYFMFGNVEVKMKAAPGTGIVSSIVMESDDLDEIDWEGVGGNPDQIQTNYFGKGDTTTYDRETWENMDNPQEDIHTYTVDWTKDAISWIIDGNSVRTVKYADAKGGSRFPQTPMRLRLGIWAGGDSDNGEGTIEWAGGKTDYSQAPFTMYIESVKIINYTPADSYKFTDTSGSYENVKASNSTDSDDSSSSTSSSDDSSSTATTTDSGSSSTGTDASTTSDSSSATSTSESTSSSSGGGSSSDSGSDSGASSTSSDSGSSSASGSSSGSSAAPTAYEGAAVSLANSYMTPAMLLALFTAMLQL